MCKILKIPYYRNYYIDSSQILHNSKRPPSRDVLEFEFERCQNPTILGKSEIWQIHILSHFNAVGVVHVLVKILLY